MAIKLRLKTKGDKSTNTPKVKKPKMLNISDEMLHGKPKNTLPKDEYTAEMVEVVSNNLDDSKHYVLSVIRQGDLGLPVLDIRQFVNTDKYSGYTRKGVSIPLEQLDLLLEKLTKIRKTPKVEKMIESLKED